MAHTIQHFSKAALRGLMRTSQLLALTAVLLASTACGRVLAEHEIGNVGEGGEVGQGGNVGGHVYAFNFGSQDVSAFDLDPSTGTLAPIPGSPYPARPGGSTTAVAIDSHLYSNTSGRVKAFLVDQTGALTPLGTSDRDDAAMTPFSMAAHPSGRFLYAGNCGQSATGAISRFAIDVGTRVAAPAGYALSTSYCPNGIAIHPSGRFLYVSAQYGYQGNVEGYSIDPTSGALTPLAGSPFSSFLAVAIAIAPNGRHVYVCDQDGSIRVYAVDAQTGALRELGFRAPTGGNPFSITADRTGERLFVGNFDDGTVSSYAVDANSGRPTEVQGSPFLAGTSPDVRTVDVSNRFLYLTDQGEDTVKAYAVGSSGMLTEVPGSPFATGHQPTAIIAIP